MFLTIFLSIWTVLHLYVFWRVATIPWITRHLPWWGIAGGAVVLWGSYIASRFLYRWGWIGVGRVVEWIGSTWLGVLLLLFATLLLADALTVIAATLARAAQTTGHDRLYHLLAHRGPALRLGAMAAAGVLSLFAVVQALRPPVVRDYDVRLADLPRELDGTVLVELSDFHLGTLIGPHWAERLVRRVNTLDPDLVVLVGDLVEGHAEDLPERFLPILRELRAPLGVWAVTGNHDRYAGTESTVRFLEKAGCRVLMNRCAEAATGLVVAGIDARHSHRADDTEKRSDAEAVSAALAGRPSGAATILLSHYPRTTIADAASSAGVGLMLSGHTHAGQIWPFSYATRRAYPLFAGRYDVDGMTVIVCRGTGTWGPRMRLWRPSEIVRITLQSEK